MSGKRAIKCSSCEYSKWSVFYKAWNCEHPDCKDISFFKGKTHPHYCPRAGGKNYIIHRNVSRNTGNLARDVMTSMYISGGGSRIRL